MVLRMLNSVSVNFICGQTLLTQQCYKVKSQNMRDVKRDSCSEISVDHELKNFKHVYISKINPSVVSLRVHTEPL